MSQSRGAKALKAFEPLWSSLFTTPIHLDSALSKLPRELKPRLAPLVSAILLRPVSLARELGCELPRGEPWSLGREALAVWKPARWMAERLLERNDLDEVWDRLPPANWEDYPPWIRAECERDWGFFSPQEASGASYEGLPALLARRAPLSVRSARKPGAQALWGEWKRTGKVPRGTSLSDISPQGIRIPAYAPILGTHWFKEGAFEIQDEGSQLMAFFALWPERYGALLQLMPGKARIPAGGRVPELPEDPPAWTVIDACAGAGGKTLALADALLGKGRVYAYDTSVTKLQALRRRMTRAGLTNVHTTVVEEGQEATLVGRFRRRAQVVLIDAPCSGWGVLRRNPDIKWRQDPQELERLTAIQARLLDVYSDLVAPGGRLVYGVCTFRRAETLELVERFLRECPDFRAGPGGFLGPEPTDGFYMQAFARVEGRSP